MATLKPNPILGTLRGKIGDLVFVPAADHTVVVKHLPVRKAEFTAGERRGQQRFAQAAAYVKQVRQQPDIYAFYQAAAKATGRRACDLAHKDFWHSPEISDIDLSAYHGQPGQELRIVAVDDCGVLAVMVALSRLDGALLEHGAATLSSEPSLWTYRAQQELAPGQTIQVHISATDRPGNVGRKTVHHALLLT